MQRDPSDGISIDVETLYVESESDPDGDRFVFAYTITIRNVGDVAAKLLTRHWVIRDANGKVQEVQGDGVVGEQPTLRPGDAFEYTSGCPLGTPSGLMHGAYAMLTAKGERFEARVPAFSLDSPHDWHRVN